MQNQNDCVTLKKSIDEKSPVSTMVSLINRVSNPINFLFTKIENLWIDHPGCMVQGSLVKNENFRTVGTFYRVIFGIFVKIRTVAIYRAKLPSFKSHYFD